MYVCTYVCDLCALMVDSRWLDDRGEGEGGGGGSRVIQLLGSYYGGRGLMDQSIGQRVDTRRIYLAISELER